MIREAIMLCPMCKILVTGRDFDRILLGYAGFYVLLLFHTAWFMFLYFVTTTIERVPHLLRSHRVG